MFLSTGKTGTILAGVVSIGASTLATREGETFSLPLQKCVDTGASLEMKVNHAWVPQERPSLGQAKSTMGPLLMRPTSPQNVRVSKNLPLEQVETRS